MPEENHTAPLSLRKRFKYAIAAPVLTGYLRGLEATARRRVDGLKHIEPFLADGRPVIPCFWHQQIIAAAVSLLELRPKGLNLGFLVSPSRDGEIPAKVFSRRGVAVIRGSSSRTGARAMRDLYLAISRDGISPCNTPDGPRGPLYHFKTGPLMLAQMTGAPVVPVAAAASRYRQFNSWDRFRLPKWGCRLALVFGEPRFVDKQTPAEQLETGAASLGEDLMRLSEHADRLSRK